MAGLRLQTKVGVAVAQHGEGEGAMSAAFAASLLAKAHLHYAKMFADARLASSSVPAVLPPSVAEPAVFAVGVSTPEGARFETFHAPNLPTCRC